MWVTLQLQLLVQCEALSSICNWFRGKRTVSLASISEQTHLDEGETKVGWNKIVSDVPLMRNAEQYTHPVYEQPSLHPRTKTNTSYCNASQVFLRFIEKAGAMSFISPQLFKLHSCKIITSFCLFEVPCRRTGTFRNKEYFLISNKYAFARLSYASDMPHILLTQKKQAGDIWVHQSVRYV